MRFLRGTLIFLCTNDILPKEFIDKQLTEIGVTTSSQIRWNLRSINLDLFGHQEISLEIVTLMSSDSIWKRIAVPPVISIILKQVQNEKKKERVHEPWMLNVSNGSMICWFTYGDWHKFSVFVLRLGGVDSNKTSKTAWLSRRTSSFHKRTGFFLHSDPVRSLPSWSEVVILYIENYLFFATVLATFLPLNVFFFVLYDEVEREIAFLQKSVSFF